MRIALRWVVTVVGMLTAMVHTPAVKAQNRVIITPNAVFVNSTPLPGVQSIRVQTTVSVPDGGTVSLGSYSRYAESRSEAGAPILGKLPYVDRGLRRLAISGKERHYFALHAVLDVKHSETWNREILRSLVAEEPRRAQAIGEGALLRLWHGACCFTRYRERFAVPVVESQAA